LTLTEGIQKVAYHEGHRLRGPLFEGSGKRSEELIDQKRAGQKPSA
jgi:hypothetical protein